MSKVLVTGAEGFIGSHLVERLIKLGHKVKAFTFYNFRGSNGWLDNIDKKLLKDLHIISGDIRDYSFLEKHSENIDVIYHLAALIAIPYSYHAPKSYIDTNITGTYNVLRSSQKNNIPKIIITSTSEVYGSAQKVPIKENHSLNAQSPYAATKIAADQLALSFYKSFDLPVTILRPFNTYGPRQSARAVIPTIISQLINKKGFVKIGNLTPTRDFTYVEDTVEAFILALKKDLRGEVVNIGNKFEISIKDLLKIFQKDFGYDFKVIVDKNRIRSKKSEVLRLLASDIKARKLLNWIPKYHGITGFKKGLEKTMEWFKNPDNIRLYNSDIYNI
jgi:dTDP-glucose 4,6-dehydratase